MARITIKAGASRFAPNGSKQTVELPLLVRLYNEDGTLTIQLAVPGLKTTLQFNKAEADAVFAPMLKRALEDRAQAAAIVERPDALAPVSGELVEFDADEEPGAAI